MTSDRLEPNEWRPHGLCLRPEMDPRWWFPSRGEGVRAKVVCAQCPVRIECLLSAVETGEEEGIWGGAGEPIRRMLRQTLDSAGKHRFLIEVQDHFDRLDEFAATGRQPAGAIRTFGPNATHGKVSTYNRGCHCPLCTAAKMEAKHRHRLTRIERTGT